MIAYVLGQVILAEANYIVVKTNGIGYQVLLSKKDLETIQIGQDVELYIHTHVREDAFDLFGFISPAHKQIFSLLISVSGIGPKIALNILSVLSPSELKNAILHKDLAKLSAAPGIGKKTAERLALELKDKIIKIDIAIPNPSVADYSVKTSLEQAIRGLGFSKSQSDKAITSLNEEDLHLPLEELIKKTLNLLAGNFAP